jgi:hypothetical protein
MTIRINLTLPAMKSTSLPTRVPSRNIRMGDCVLGLPPEHRTRIAVRLVAAWMHRVSLFLFLLLLVPPFAPGQDSTGIVDMHPASVTSPGHFSGSDLPQFILVTFDDGITSFAESFIQPVVGGLVNPDGSKVSVTYFVTKVNTDTALARQRYLDGNELASHTTTHTTGNQTTFDQWMWELTEMNRFLVNSVGLPSNQISGFRAPELQTNSGLWRALEQLGFTYDASLSEQLTVPRGASRSIDSLVWPYTMQDGAKGACLAQACPDTSLPGLWSIPLWDFYDPSGNDLGSMDPAVVYDSTFSASLEYLFAARYRGNHCPLGLFMHAGQLWSPTRQAIIRSFLQDKLKLQNVWMITMRGLLEWMRNPVPASELSQWFAAGKARGIGEKPRSFPSDVSLVLPAHEAQYQDARVTLLWNVVLSAADYELQVAADPSFASLVLDTVALAKTTLTLPPSLPSGRFWWRVRARNALGFGQWSASNAFNLALVTSVGFTTSMPEAPVLEQNFPNPFNPTTEITFSLPHASRAKLVIYDLLGREVATLLNASLPAGTFRTRWDAHDVASGAYVCRLELDGTKNIQSRKLLLVR